MLSELRLRLHNDDSDDDDDNNNNNNTSGLHVRQYLQNCAAFVLFVILFIYYIIIHLRQ